MVRGKRGTMVYVKLRKLWKPRTSLQVMREVAPNEPSAGMQCVDRNWYLVKAPGLAQLEVNAEGNRQAILKYTGYVKRGQIERR